MALTVANAASAETASGPIATRSDAVRAGSTLHAVDLSTLAGLLQDQGFAAEVKREKAGAYVLAKSGSSQFQAFATQCAAAETGCTDIELYAGFAGAPRTDLARLNAWNARTRFARGFLTEAGDPGLQMDVTLQGGVSSAALQSQFEIWSEALDTFALYLLAEQQRPSAGAR